MSSSEYTLAGTKQAEGLWVLRAEDTVFRVSGGILSARSTVFRDMLSLPQPSTSIEDTIDGCSVIRLPDSATEVESFLRAIFDSNFFMPPPAPVDFDVVIGILRLAHKYDTQYLFRRALSHLDLLYPIDFDTCTKVHGRVFSREVHHIRFNRITTSTIVALRVASEVGAIWMLPMIYYTIVCWSSFEGVELGSAADMLAADKMLCLAAQTNFLRQTLTSYRVFAGVPHQDCTSKDCYYFSAESRNYLDYLSDEGLDVNPLRAVDRDMQLINGCPLCREYLAEAAVRFTSRRRQFWEKLPSRFGLPGWDELKEMRRAVIES
ncbi:BTB domain-containing protein [Favolaschia claudopus]|uniref:BTB domain-containing protein n=1 Tax=Favolaschia claudopus TaxID=2862362 RepID=A0AAV9ZU69_9AGAR